MSDWAPGDLALCVRSFATAGVQAGSVHTVSAIIWDRGANSGIFQMGLLLEGVELRDGYTGFAARRFRKIRPHTPDAEDRETIRLLNGKPVPVEA